VNFTYNPGILPSGGFDYLETKYYLGSPIGVPQAKQVAINSASYPTGCTPSPIQQWVDLSPVFYIQGGAAPSPTPTTTPTITPTITPTPSITPTITPTYFRITFTIDPGDTTGFYYEKNENGIISTGNTTFTLTALNGTFYQVRFYDTITGSVYIRPGGASSYSCRPNGFGVSGTAVGGQTFPSWNIDPDVC
jgi:hypothetical protein